MVSPFFPRLAGLLCLLCLLSCFPATHAEHQPVTVEVAGRTLSADTDPYIYQGTAYVPLSAFVREMEGGDLTWDGTSALLDTDRLDLLATPGQLWLEANGRALYVPHTIQMTDGRVMVPVRTAAQLFGAEVTWDEELQTVRVSAGSEILPHADTHYDPDTLYWLSRVISAESRGEPLEGQIAVGNVALNRVASSSFPDTLYSVIFQPGQFEPVENGTIWQEPYYLSVTAAKLCLEGAQIIGDCLYFFAPDLSPGTWIVNNRTYYTTIGCHRFYL
ncbi:MAG: cell wall hydrolase [Oscillospiraceae bacterium]|nr:cell wall hydrolase [Oscillospiraceae bacterium]